MRLFLVRHGQTIENIERIIQGQSDGRLTDEGKEQARKLAERLKRESFDAIFSSDLGRAADTAREIAKHHPDTPLKFVEELRERDAGPYTGMKWEDVSWTWESLPEEVESWESMRSRAMKFLDSVYHKFPGGTVLFVSHGGLLNALIGELRGEPLHGNSFIRLGNTSITIVELAEKDNHRIELLNCVEHLG